MSESSLLSLLRSHWLEITRQFWPEEPCGQLEAELARLEAVLRRRQSRLLASRRKIESLRDRLNHREHRLAQLSAQIQQSGVDGCTTAELERQRRSIDRIRVRLQKQERGYAGRLALLRERKQEWLELRERLLSGSLPKPTDVESDPDYPF